MIRAAFGRCLVLLAELWLGSIVPARAQGTVQFVTRWLPYVDAPVFDTNGITRLEGAAYAAQLYAGAPGGILRPVGTVVRFGTGTNAGYVQPRILRVAVPNVLEADTADVELRAWDRHFGDSYEAAQSHRGPTGSSDTLRLATGYYSPNTPGVPLVGLRPFQLAAPGERTVHLRSDSVAAALPGSSVRLAVVSRGLTSPTRWEWHRNGVLLPEVTVPEAVLPNVTAADAGDYTVRVTDAAGTVQSPPCPVSVSSVPRLLGFRFTPREPALFQPLRIDCWVEGTAASNLVWSPSSLAPSSATPRAVTAAAFAGPYSVRLGMASKSEERRLHEIGDPKVHWETAYLDLVTDEGFTIVPEPTAEIHRYRRGSVVLLSVQTEPGYEFLNWTGFPFGSEPRIYLGLDRTISVGARVRPVGASVWLQNLARAPVRTSVGIPAEGGDYRVQLVAGPASDALRPVGAPIPLGTGASAGYFDGGRVLLPETAPGATVYARIQAWRGAALASFEAAREANQPFGNSPVFTFAAGGGDRGLTPLLDGFTGLALVQRPIVQESPVPVVRVPGGAAHFTCRVEVYGAARFVWLKDGVEFRVTDVPELLIDPVAEDSAGAYRLRVETEHGTAESDPAILTVVPPLVLAPVSIDPAHPRAGRPVRFVVTSENYPPDQLGFQWLLDGQPIPNATGSLLEIAAPAPGTYEVLVTWSADVSRVEVANLPPAVRVVRVATPGGSIRLTPDLAEYDSGAILEIQALPDPGFRFVRWRQGPTGPDNPAIISLPAKPEFMLEAVFAPEGGSVVLANRSSSLGLDAPVFDRDGTTLLEGPAYLAQLYAGPTFDTLAPIGAPTPFLTGPAAGYFFGGERFVTPVPPGETAYAQFRVWAVAGGSTYEDAYDANAPIGTSDIVSVVTGNAGTPPTVPSFLLGLAPFALVGESAPRLVTSPQPAAVILGALVRFTATALARPAPTYQWLLDGREIPGATGRRLEIAAVRLTDAGEYSVRAENPLGRVTSSPALLQVLLPPAIAALPTPGVHLAGERATLAVTVTGTPPFNFRWFEGESGDTTHPIDPVEAVLTTPPLRTTARFWVRIANRVGSIDSPTVTVPVELRSQKIVFDPLPDCVYGQPPLPLAASASSGLPVVFSVVSGPGTLAASRLTITGPGEIRIRASQPGDLFHLPALDVERTLFVARVPVTVTLAGLEILADGLPHRPTVVTQPAGIPVRLEFDGRTEAPSLPGRYHVLAVAEDATHHGLAEATFVILPHTHPLSVLVFLDRNANGRRDDEEPGLGGIVIQLESASAAPTLSATTGADGLATFPEAPAGTITLREINPSDVLDTTLNELTVVLPLPTGAAPPAFGDQRAGVAVGTVFLDRDGNGLRDPGEPGRGGIPVRLIPPSGPVRESLTAAAGGFAFGPIAPGSYRLEAMLPAGFAATTPASRSFPLLAGQGATIDFGQQLVGTIAGRAFLDLDGNGEAGSQESGVPGATIRLTDLSGRRPSELTTTDATGAFAFDGIPAGDYAVEETDPPGYTSSTPNAQAVHLASGGAASVRFGDLLAHTISGIVFDDWNGNGRRDPAEPGIDRAAIRLARAADDVNVAETVTGDSGVFVFSGLAAGEYLAHETVPDTYTRVAPSAASPAPPALASHAPRPAADPDRVATRWVQLPEFGAATIPFANHRTGVLTGRVFHDLDGDGTPSARDTGLAGIAVRVRDTASGAVPGDVVTDASGYFSVPDLGAGSYQATIEPVPGFVATRTSQRLLLPARGAAIANFACGLAGSAAARVFNDTDGDGEPGSDEPALAGIAVRLARHDGRASDLVTTADGTAVFSEIANEPATLTIVVPEGFVATTSDRIELMIGPETAARASFGLRSRAVRAPEFVVQPSDLAFFAGSDVTLSATVTGWAPIEYQWFKDDRPLPSATETRLVLPFAKDSAAGAYRLQARNPLGTVSSRTAVVTTASSDPFDRWAIAAGLPAHARGRADDPDGDGLPNVFEFLLGTRPLDVDPESAPSARPRPVFVPGITGTFTGFEFTHSHAAASLEIQLAASDDLLRWVSVAPIVTRVSPGADADVVRLYHPMPLGDSSPRFLRLGIAPPTP